MFSCEQVEDGGDPPFPEPHPRSHALGLELLGPGVGGLREHFDAGLRPQLVAEEVGRVRGQRQLRTGQHLSRIPVGGEIRRRHLQMQLHAGASGFGRDGRGLPTQRLGTGDVDRDVLAAGGEDRVVEGRVSGRFAHPVLVQMFGHQRGQDADHHDVGSAGAGLGLGFVQAGPHLCLQVQAGMSGQWPRGHVEFDVVGAQFGLVGRIRDGVQHEPIRHGGLIVGVDEVALDLHAGERPVRIEAESREHRLEDVQTQPHLAPVFLPLCAVIRGALDLFAHNADATGLSAVAQGGGGDPSARGA